MGERRLEKKEKIVGTGSSIGIYSRDRKRDRKREGITTAMKRRKKSSAMLGLAGDMIR